MQELAKTHLDNDIGYDDALLIKLNNLLSDICDVIVVCVCVSAMFESIFYLVKALTK